MRCGRLCATIIAAILRILRRISAKESIQHESSAHQRQPPREGLHLHRPFPYCRGAEGTGHRDRDPARRRSAGGVVNEAIEKAKTADAFVFGSPVHYASAAGNMASFMDRLAYAGGKYLAYKPAAVCCSARRAGTTSTLDQLVKYPQFFHMPLVNGSYWAMVHGSNPEQVLQDAEGCAVMQELGRNMAWLLHCIEAGKAAGIDHPQNPPRPMTNFIR